MSKIKLLTFLISGALTAFGCGGSVSNKAVNANLSRNSNVSVPVNSAAPSTPKAVEPPPSTPAANAAALPSNTAPVARSTPPAETKKPVKPGVSPTSGIPSADEMQKAFGKAPKPSDENSPAMMKGTPMKAKPVDVPMMKAKPAELPMMKPTRKPGGKP